MVDGFIAQSARGIVNCISCLSGIMIGAAKVRLSCKKGIGHSSQEASGMISQTVREGNEFHSRNSSSVHFTRSACTQVGMCKTAQFEFSGRCALGLF